MRTFAQIVRRELARREKPSKGVLILVGDDEYRAAVADGRVARARSVVRIVLVDPPPCLDDPPPSPALVKAMEFHK